MPGLWSQLNVGLCSGFELTYARLREKNSCNPLILLDKFNHQLLT